MASAKCGCVWDSGVLTSPCKDHKEIVRDLELAQYQLKEIHEVVDHLSCAHGFQSCVVCEIKAVLAQKK